MATLRFPVTGSVVTGTQQDDLLIIPSGFAHSSQFFAKGGSDSVEFAVGELSAIGFNAQLQGGPDEFIISGIVLKSSVVNGGAGSDTIELLESNVTANTIYGGYGSDVIHARSSNLSNVRAGAGADIVSTETGSKLSADSTQILMGAGKDTLVIVDSNGSASDLDALTIAGGGGDDLISVENSTSVSRLYIHGDASGASGNDEINVILTSEGLTVLGGGGQDSIEISGSVQNDSKIAGGAGADSIVLSAVFEVDNGLSVLGGAGEDSISILSGFTSRGFVHGGSGSDSISFVFDQNIVASMSTVVGGSGSDTVHFDVANISAGVLNGVGFVIGIDSLGDSNVENPDLYLYNNPETGLSSGTKFGVNLPDALVPLTAAANSGEQLIVSAGVATFSALDSIDERVSSIDSQLSSVGEYVVFGGIDSNVGYLFVQGGSSDLLLKFENETASIENLSIMSGNGQQVNLLLG